jgi:hypothetical protein
MRVGGLQLGCPTFVSAFSRQPQWCCRRPGVKLWMTWETDTSRLLEWTYVILYVRLFIETDSEWFILQWNHLISTHLILRLCWDLYSWLLMTVNFISFWIHLCLVVFDDWVCVTELERMILLNENWLFITCVSAFARRVLWVQKQWVAFKFAIEVHFVSPSALERQSVVFDY